MKNADVESCLEQLKKLFEFRPEEVLKLSAKTGMGVKEALDAVVQIVPPPSVDHADSKLKATVFDSWYEKFKGIVLLVRINNGQLQVGDSIVFSTQTKKTYVVKELNVMHPTQVPISDHTLRAGQVGVLVANIHDYEDVSVGDTVVINEPSSIESIRAESKTKSLRSNPMVYASIYPCEKANFIDLNKSLHKLMLNDGSVHMTKESHAALGNGFK